MANATRAEIRDLIRVKRPELLSNTNFPNSVIDELINQAQRFVQLNLAHLGIKQWEAVDTLTLSSGAFMGTIVKTAPLSTDCPNRLFDDERAIKYIQVNDVSIVYGQAFYVDDEEFFEQIVNTFLLPVITKPIYTRHNQLILISPVTVTLAIAHYYKQVEDMTTDTAETEIPEMYEEHIVRRVLVDIDDILGKPQNKQMNLQQLTTDLQQSFQSQELAVASDKRPKDEVLQ